LVVKALQTPKIDGRHAATRTFQALRIHVNDELGELERGLAAAERLLKPGGRLVVVTFHSLEDGLVKRFLQGRTGRTPRGSRHAPVATSAETPPSFRFVNHRPVSPSEAELARNPRSRSARLRQAVRTDAPAWDAAVDERG
jgi:16S rRNA (cytosine1402-N4)-methyltransferase